MNKVNHSVESLRLIANQLKDRNQPLEALVLGIAANRLEELEDVLKDYIKEDRMPTPDDLMKPDTAYADYMKKLYSEKIIEIPVVNDGSPAAILVAKEVKERREERNKALSTCFCFECEEKEMYKDRHLGLHWIRIISDDR